MKDFYRVTFEIEHDEYGIAFLKDLVDSQTINSRDNEEGQIIGIKNLTIQSVNQIDSVFKIEIDSNS